MLHTSMAVCRLQGASVPPIRCRISVVVMPGSEGPAGMLGFRAGPDRHPAHRTDVQRAAQSMPRLRIVRISGTSNSFATWPSESRRPALRRAGASRRPASPRPRSRRRARRRRSSSPAPRSRDRRACSTARSGSRNRRCPAITGSSRPGDVDAVVDDVAGMGDPLAAAHELVFDRLAEGVAHAAVIAGKADAASHRRGEVAAAPPSRSSTWCRSARSGSCRRWPGSAKASVVFST